MKNRLADLLDRPQAVHAAMLASLLLGLFFTFVWAPHPWGWQGIDQYHALASALARGEPFATTDVPWGYAYFAAFFYRLFGTHVLVPVVAQVVINASAPWLLYKFVRPWTTQRVAVLASVLTGVLSFNNIYASTQASDALCTVLFLASLLAFSSAIRTGKFWLFIAAGLLAGIVPQFRPNMILFPGIVAFFYVVWTRAWRPLVNTAIYLAFAGLALTPWIARNYALTSLFLPTSTHGGVQLWYGTLQVGPYLESRAHNPRSILDTPAFHYTSLAGIPIRIEAMVQTCASWNEATVTLYYWTDRDPAKRTVKAGSHTAQSVVFEVPGQPLDTTLYYYFEAAWTADGAAKSMNTPTTGERTPFVYFVSRNHLGDLDRHGDLEDIFDFARMASSPATPLERLQELAKRRLAQLDASPNLVSNIERGERVVVTFVDGSRMTIPPSLQRVTDLELTGGLAAAMASAGPSTAAVNDEVQFPIGECRLTLQPRVNDVFYRAEPHLMNRYMALAFDNISRDPAAFVAASAYRMLRLFIVRGTSDVNTAQQFSLSRIAYPAASVVSTAYLLMFMAGAWIAWRRRSALVWLLIPIVYVPLTICFVLTNMRYTVTMQPLMFVFVALTILTALGLDPPGSGERSGGKVV